MEPKSSPPPAPTGNPPEDPRPRYEPPRIVKRRSVLHATLFTGVTAQGIATIPPPASTTGT